MYTERVIVRLTAQQLAKLNKLAKDNNKNQSDIIRKLIENG